MKKDKIELLKTPEKNEIKDPLTEMLRAGAKKLILQAVEEELEEQLLLYQDKLEDGRKAVVRNGHLPSRTIQTGIGEVEIKVPKIRDRSVKGRKFNSSLLPPYLKRTKNMEDLIPWLYLKGISTGGFQEALSALLGDGAMGFWNALSNIYPDCKHQRCWVHKTANVLNKVSKSMQAKVKQSMHDIWMADTKDEAKKAFDYALECYDAKYPKAMECLRKDQEELLSFYDFPAEHWAHIRTTNPIESTFATLRLRSKRSKNCGSRDTTLAMVYKLMESAQKKWRKIQGFRLLTLVVNNVPFANGELAAELSNRNVA